MFLLHYYRDSVLASRYRDRFAGNIEALDRAFGRFLGGLSEDSVKKLNESRCKVVKFHELKTIEGADRIERAIIYDNRSKEETTLEVDDVVVNFGFVANLGPIKTWGLTIQGNSIVVSQKMETNLPGIFAAGDIVTYPGKLKLIATGFGEATMAVCAAKLIVDPSARYFPGHSSESSTFEPGAAHA